MSEPRTHALAYYDPHRLGEPDFIAGFVARGNLLDFFVDQLRAAASGGGAHFLIVGQRGMGKTSLLRRTAIAIERDEALGSVLVPLTFREEQYNVRTLGQFWQNCGEALAEALERVGDTDEADKLDLELQTPAWHRDVAGEAFQAKTRALGRRPVLLVDNLDLILNAVPDEEHWTLRNALQRADGPLLYGAATQIPMELGDAAAAFYEFFRVEALDPLSERELTACLRNLALLAGKNGESVLAILRDQPARLKVLHTLSGGNPRILTFIYGILERAENESVYADLERLLDQLTPVYKARVEDLRSEIQRAAFDGIALNWDPIASGEIVALTGIQATTLSPQLIRMRDSGLISEVPSSGSRSAFQVAERFFNIWYLMRHGTRRTRQRMRWLTAFLQTFYSLEDLHGMADRIERDDADNEWRPLYAEALHAAIEDKKRVRTSRDAAPSESIASNEGAGSWFVEGARLLAAKRYVDAEALFRAHIEEVPDDANAWYLLALSIPMTRDTDVIAAFRQALELDPEHSGALIRLSTVLTNKDALDEAETLVRKAIEVDPADPCSWQQLGEVLLKRGDPAAAEASLREAVALDPDGKHLSFWGYEQLGTALEALSRLDEAVVAQERAVAIAPNDWQRWDVLGDVVFDLKDFERAADHYRHAITLDSRTAWPHHGLGRSLIKMGELDEGINELRLAAELDPNAVQFWVGLGHALISQRGSWSEARTVFENAIKADPDNVWPHLGLGVTLWRLDMNDPRAEAALRKAIALDASSSLGWQGLGQVLSTTHGRSDEARAAYAKALELDSRSGFAWTNLGILLKDAGDVEAEAALRRGVELQPSERGRTVLASLLETQERYAEAAEVYDAALEQHPDNAPMWLRLGMLRQYRFIDTERGEAALRRALSFEPGSLSAKRHLYWSLLWQRRIGQAEAARGELGDISEHERALMDAGLAIEAENFGSAVAHLHAVLAVDMQDWTEDDFLTLVQLFRQFRRIGLGDRLVAWLGEADRPTAARLFMVAMSAYLHGERKLLDVNPEMRTVAASFYRMLASSKDGDAAPARKKPAGGAARKRRRRDDRT